LAWTAASVLAFAAAPMGVPILLPLCAVAPLAWYWAAHRRFPVFRPLKVMMALLLTSLYLLLNTAWSLSPWDALSAVAEFFVIIAILHLIANMLVASEDRVLRAMAAGVVTGVIMAGALRRAILSYIPALWLHARHLVVENGWVASALPHVLNPSSAAPVTSALPYQLSQWCSAAKRRYVPQSVISLRTT
jgi:hypothetical protein